ncbi:MAG TPA: ATP-binding cassette domain-containing protein, partial [Spongiibacteraceae bacterium]|nr:ATP-binding cassette domain-containing protein [Spongiibacteraceae bacterium]
LARLLAGELETQRGSLLRPADGAVALVGFEQQRQLMAHDNRFDDSDVREDAFDVGSRVRDVILQGRPADARYSSLVQRFRMAHILERGIRFISTGEARKTLLVRALLAAPEALILDNPYEGLDQASQQEMRGLLEELLQGELPVMVLVKQAEEIPAGITHVLALEHGLAIYQGPRAGYRPGAAAAQRIWPALPAASPVPVAAGQPLIELAGVNLSYGDTPVLRDIHWRLYPGDHCCIRGPNGAGKSSLLSLLTGDNHKVYGQPLSLLGRRRGSGESVWEVKALFGVVSTALQLQHIARVRVAEVVASGFFDSVGLYQDCSDQQRHQALAWLDIIGLQDQATQRFETLSFGEQRLALVARAMVKAPRFLVLDEPCLGLDTQHRADVLSLADHIAASGHTQLLYVSHSAGEAPRAINQWLDLVPHPDGGSTLRVSRRPD